MASLDEFKERREQEAIYVIYTYRYVEICIKGNFFFFPCVTLLPIRRYYAVPGVLDVSDRDTGLNLYLWSLGLFCF